jgi:photoactive yellow protein
VTDEDKDRPISTQEAAELLGVGTSSVKRWADDGRLPTIKTPGGHRRFSRRDVKAFGKSLKAETKASKAHDSDAPIHTRLSSMSPQEIDALPVGVIGLNDEGYVTLYNRFEADFAGIPEKQALGTHFFTELAPCTNNRIIYGRFKDGISKGQLDEELFYTFTYRMRATSVMLRLFRDPEGRQNWLVVTPAGSP